LPPLYFTPLCSLESAIKSLSPWYPSLSFMPSFLRTALSDQDDQLFALLRLLRSDEVELSACLK